MSSSDSLSLGMKRSGRVHAAFHSERRRAVRQSATHPTASDLQNGALIIVLGCAGRWVRTAVLFRSLGLLYYRAVLSFRRSFFIFCQGEAFRLRGPAWMVCLRRAVEKRRHLDRVLCGLTCPLRFLRAEAGRRRYIIHADSLLPIKDFPCQLIKKGSRPAIGRKPYSRFNHLLHHT